MTKCRLCGESNPDTNRFCSNCGARLEEKDNSALTEALENAEKEFDKDSMVSLDKSRITYVCTVCGSVNRIDQEKCSRCGKPRPRSEYVNALRRIKQGNAMREEQAREQPARDAAVYGNGQAPAIQQPFVIVPYVNPMQPLWQYNPDQLYRYEPYTPEELEARRAEREMAEMQRKAQEGANREANYEAEPFVAEKPVSARSGRFTAIALITLILTVAAGVIAYIGGAVDMLAAYAGVSFFDIASDVTSATGWALMAPVCAVIFLAIAAILLVRSVVRLIRGKAATRGWFIPLVWVVSFAAFFIGCGMADGNFDASALSAVASDIGIGGWILAAIAVITTVVSCFSVKTAKEKKDTAVL